jgi:hypothetical protein
LRHVGALDPARAARNRGCRFAARGGHAQRADIANRRRRRDFARAARIGTEAALVTAERQVTAW